jgi:hypothetical protein
MPSDLSLALPLMKSIGNEESRVNAVAKGGVCNGKGWTVIFSDSRAKFGSL